MKPKDVAELLNEPACEHNTKSKSGCTRPKPGSTAGGCAFDGAQITLIPIADVAHIVHGPIACAGSSWDNRGSRSSGPELYRLGMTTDLTEQDVIMGRGEKRLFHSIKQAIDNYKPAAVFIYNTCVPALIGDDIEAVCKASQRRWGCPSCPIDCAGFYRDEEPRATGSPATRWSSTSSARASPTRSPRGRTAGHPRPRRQPDRRVQHRRRALARDAPAGRARPARPRARSRATPGSARCRRCTGRK